MPTLAQRIVTEKKVSLNRVDIIPTIITWPEK